VVRPYWSSGWGGVRPNEDEPHFVVVDLLIVWYLLKELTVGYLLEELTASRLLRLIVLILHALLFVSQ
jgi:hypothetical protein